MNILQTIGSFDERDEQLFSDLTRAIVVNNGSKYNESIKQNDEWSISRRLSEYFNVTSKEQHNKAISFGKVLVKKYREIFSEDPPKRNQYVNGTIRSVNCYYREFWQNHGDVFMKDYFGIVEEE